jgi:hypothetical protein
MVSQTEIEFVHIKLIIFCNTEMNCTPDDALVVRKILSFFVYKFYLS